MKKLLTIITLFVSSFFLFFLEDVKAYEHTKEIDFSLMEDVLSLKEKLDLFIETDTKYSDYYIISYESSVIYYYLLPINGSIDLFTTTISDNLFRVVANQSLKGGSNLTNINPSSGVSGKSFNMYHSVETLTNDIIIYTNFDFKFTISNHIVTYTYQDFSYSENFVKGNKVSTLYDIYLKYQEYLGNYDLEHKEEIEKLESFYTIIIEKLSYLAEKIASNYIYLSIIVIFILILVFEMIFRRYL